MPASPLSRGKIYQTLVSSPFDYTIGFPQMSHSSSISGREVRTSSQSEATVSQLDAGDQRMHKGRTHDAPSDGVLRLTKIRTSTRVFSSLYRTSAGTFFRVDAPCGGSRTPRDDQIGLRAARCSLSDVIGAPPVDSTVMSQNRSPEWFASAPFAKSTRR